MSAKDHDDEALAMVVIANVLGPLKADARHRVLGWACDKFRLEPLLIEELTTVAAERNTLQQKVDVLEAEAAKARAAAVNR